MVVSLLRQMKHALGTLLGKRGEVVQDLEFALITKGDMTQREALWLEAIRLIAKEGFVSGSAVYSFLGWFGLGIGPKLLGFPPMFKIHHVCCSGGTSISGKIIYYAKLQNCALATLYSKEERMKLELANIILTKHSDDKSLVEAVKGQFFAEHLFSDLHQDTPVFRWHTRHSYVDRAFVERMKDIEAEDGDAHDEARSTSRQATLNTRSFGDLVEDPLACVLGSPGGDMDSSNLSETTGAALKRRHLRTRRKCHHQQQQQYADKFGTL